jgi:DNA-binding NarL/FixJ family response regulator
VTGPRVLLVDDDRAIREALRDVLGEVGMEIVGEAANGVDGVSVAKAVEPDVVVMDLRMPRLGGLDAARMIRRALPATQVVLFTVYDDQALTEAGARAGVFAYLVKGCPPGQVAEVIHQAWQWKRGLEVTGVRPPAG